MMDVDQPDQPDHSFAAGQTFKSPSLPTELRLMVWTETILQPRIIHITCQETTGTPHRFADTTIRFRVREPSPIAFQICRESRALAKRHFFISLYHSVVRLRLYYNPELDTIFFVDFDQHAYQYWYYLFQQNDNSIIREAKMLAFGVRGPLTETNRSMLADLCLWKRLKTLILVVDTEAEGNEEGRIREIAEDALTKIRNTVTRWRGERFRWMPPELKVMDLQAFESHL